MSRKEVGGIQGAGAGAASEALTSDDIKKNVEDLLSQERVVIFSKESCPYCYDAKNVSSLVRGAMGWAEGYVYVK
jgi:hypothetical protein